MIEVPNFAGQSLEEIAKFVVKHGKKDALSAWLQGKALVAAKAGHPKEFTAWLRDSLAISVATAYRYMAVADKIGADEIGKLTLWEAYKVACPPKKRGTTTTTTVPSPSEVRKLTGYISAGSWKSGDKREREEWEASLRELLASVEAALAGVGVSM